MTAPALGLLVAASLVAGCAGQGAGISKLSGGPEIVGHRDGLEIGHQLMEAGEYDHALSAYETAVSQQGLTADVLSALGSASLKLGRLGQAQRYLEQAVEMDERYPAAWNNLGVVYANLDEPHQSEAAFRAAFASDNGRSKAIWQNLLRAIEQTQSKDLRGPSNAEFSLVRRANGRFLLLETPA